MRHILISLSMYGPEMPVEWNELRLEMIESTSAPSIRYQTTRDFEWLVTLHPDDPLLARRIAAFESGGVGCRFVYLDPASPTRLGEPEGRVNPGLAASTVENWWEVSWRIDQLLSPVLSELHEPMLLTRFDDDDAFATDALQRVEAAAAGNRDPNPVVWMLPQGLLVWYTPPTPTEIQPFRHPLNGFSSFQVPPGSRIHPFSYGHNKVADHLPVRVVDEEIAWAEFRHHDNMSRFSRKHARASGRLVGVGGASGTEMTLGQTIGLTEASTLLAKIPLDWRRWQ